MLVQGDLVSEVTGSTPFRVCDIAEVVVPNTCICTRSSYHGWLVSLQTSIATWYAILTWITYSTTALWMVQGCVGLGVRSKC